MNLLSRLILRWAGWVVLLSLLATVPATYYSVQLYKNLRTDLEELLPATARSVVDLNEVKNRLHSIDSLAVLVFSDDPKASRRLIDDLAAKLKTFPQDVIAGVDYKIDTELKFFGDRKALYVDVADLVRIRDYIRDRVDYEKKLYNPLNIFSGEELPEPKLDFKAMLKKYEGRASSYSRFPGGYYATPDEKKRVILVEVPGSTGMDRLYKLKKAVEDSLAELKPVSYSSDIEIKYTGGVQNVIEEHEALIEDLELSTVIVMVVVTIAMLVFYRAVRATFALVLSLLMGTLWTFGLSYFAIGYLNANSAFLGSIVIGNGINFGIIMLARYVEERRRGCGNTRAVKESMIHTATSTWTAALAAGLSYGSLTLTSFRGFNQFGVIGLIGMVLCWFSAFATMPALLTVMDRFRPIIKRSRVKRRSYVMNGVTWFVRRWARAIWAVSFAATLVSFGTLFRYTPEILETNLAKLRNRESMERGSGFLSKHVDEIFQRYLAPTAVLPRNLEDVEPIAAALKARKESEGKKSLFAAVSSLSDFLPKEQTRKIELLKEIRRLLPPRILERMSVQDRKLTEDFLNPESLHEVRGEDLPPLIRRKFTERDGTLGRLVLVEPPLNSDQWKGDQLIGFSHQIRAAADAVAPGTPVAGTLPLAADMVEAVSHDGPRATLFAFLAVVLLVVFLFRSPSTIGLCLFALLLGMVWLAGIILGFQVKINFLNFIALPITFGIGVDYGVNIFQRYREEGGRNILTVIRHTGGAVGLCSFTTVVGYSSLLIARNRGFVSFGLLAVLGELTCVVAAVVALPAFLSLAARKRRAG